MKVENDTALEKLENFWTVLPASNFSCNRMEILGKLQGKRQFDMTLEEQSLISVGKN